MKQSILDPISYVFIVNHAENEDALNYGIEFTDKWGKTERIDNITTDFAFFQSIMQVISRDDLSACHLRDIVEDLVVEKYSVF